MTQVKPVPSNWKLAEEVGFPGSLSLSVKAGMKPCPWPDWWG